MNQYTLDGVKLRDPALRWHPNRETGIRVVPARRVPDQAFPGVDGSNFIPGASYNPGSIALALDVRGTDYRSFRENLELITAVIAQRHKLLDLRDHYDNNATNDRIAQVSLASSVEPVMTSNKSAIITAVMSVPKAFWRSASTYDAATPQVTNTASTHTLTGFTGGNAPIDDMLIRIRGGAFSSMTIKDPAGGRQLNINTALLATETMLIDPANWKAIIVSGTSTDTWSMNQGRNVSANVEPNVGYGSMLLIEPSLNSLATAFNYNVTVAGTNVSGSPTVTFRARRSYL